MCETKQGEQGVGRSGERQAQAAVAPAARAPPAPPFFLFTEC